MTDKCRVWVGQRGLRGNERIILCTTVALKIFSARVNRLLAYQT